MKRFLATVIGTEPLLMNPVTKELLLQVRNKTSPPKRPNMAEWPISEEAREKLLFGDEYGPEFAGKVGLPRENLYAALKYAGRKVKNGRWGVSTATTTTMYSFLKIQEPFLVITGTTPDEACDPPDLRPGRNPNGGQMVVLVRPKFREWGFECTVDIDEKTANTEVGKQLFDTAGRISGLGDFRPSTGGPFGSFGVKSWVEIPYTGGSIATDADEIDRVEALEQTEAELEAAELTGKAGNGKAKVTKKELETVVG